MKIESFVGKSGIPAGVQSSTQPVVQTAEGRNMSDPERPRPDASFKINDSLRQISQSQSMANIQVVTEERIELKARDAIREQDVVAALEEYVQQHSPEPTVAIALKTHRPEIKGEKIIVAVDNQLQMDKIEALCIHIQNALIKSLNNGFITVAFEMFDHQTSREEKKLFTAGEKFEHFVRLNPVVANLKSIFGLELD